MKNASTHFSELDGLRGILALWVAISHILCWTGISDNAWRLPNSMKEGWYIVMYAQAAVDAFIILSGFVISFLVAKFKTSYASLITNRAFRIYPVYLICLALAVATTRLAPLILQDSTWSNSNYFPALRSIAQSEHAYPLKHIGLHLSLLNGLIPKTLLPNSTATFLPPAWSITLEWQYYLLAPFIATLVTSSRGIIVLLLISLIGMHVSPQWTNSHLAFLPSQLPLFLIGISTYHLFQIRNLYHWATSNRIEYTTVAFCGIALLMQWHSVALTIWVLTVGSLITGKVDRPNMLLSQISRFLRTPGLQRLGDLSYPLYLVHWPLIIILLYAVLSAFPEASSLTAATILLVFGLPFILAISYLLHKTIEAPGIALGKRLITLWRRQTANAVA